MDPFVTGIAVRLHLCIQPCVIAPFVSLHVLQSLADYGGEKPVLIPQGLQTAFSFRDCAGSSSTVAQGLSAAFSLLIPLHKSGFCLNGTASVKPSLFTLSCYSLLIFLSPYLFAVDYFLHLEVMIFMSLFTFSKLRYMVQFLSSRSCMFDAHMLPIGGGGIHQICANEWL